MNHISNNGFIVLHRKMVDWEWYQDANTMRLFVHCILKANHKARKWQGIDINRGQFLTSSDTLAADLKLSRQQIRTSLNKLKSTNEITISTTARYSMITVSSYNEYQDKGKPDNQRVTNKQPTDNQLVTTNNNDNNENNDNNTKIATLSVFSDYGFSDEQVKLIYDNRKKNSKTAKAAIITVIIANSICKEMKKCTELGYTVDAVLNEWHETTWATFKSDWIQKRIPLNNQEANNYERNQFKPSRKKSLAEQVEDSIKIGDRKRAEREALRNNGEVLESDDSIVSTQIHIN